MQRNAVLILFFVAAAAVAATYPDKIRIDAAAKKQLPVPFDHAAHGTRAKSCDTCHHTQKGLTKAQADKAVKCSTCHLDPKDKAPSMREMSLTKNPFHIRCIACHKAEKKGPTGACNGCHKK